MKQMKTHILRRCFAFLMAAIVLAGTAITSPLTPLSPQPSTSLYLFFLYASRTWRFTLLRSTACFRHLFGTLISTLGSAPCSPPPVCI